MGLSSPKQRQSDAKGSWFERGFCFWCKSIGGVKTLVVELLCKRPRGAWCLMLFGEFGGDDAEDGGVW